MLGSSSTYTFLALKLPAVCFGLTVLLGDSRAQECRCPDDGSGLTFLSFHLSFYPDKCEFKGSLSGSNAGITSIEFDSAVSIGYPGK